MSVRRVVRDEVNPVLSINCEISRWCTGCSGDRRSDVSPVTCTVTTEDMLISVLGSALIVSDRCDSIHRISTVDNNRCCSVREPSTSRIHCLRVNVRCDRPTSSNRKLVIQHCIRRCRIPRSYVKCIGTIDCQRSIDRTVRRKCRISCRPCTSAISRNVRCDSRRRRLYQRNNIAVAITNNLSATTIRLLCSRRNLCWHWVC